VVPLGQAIGRWGNFANKELYGPPTTLPWGLQIPCANRVAPYFCDSALYGPETAFHPLFFYEFLWNIFVFLFLLFVWNRFRHALRRGDILLLYLFFYPIGRFVLEFLRVETALVSGININQTIMGVTALVVAGLLVYRHRPGAVWTPPAPAAPAPEDTAADAAPEDAADTDTLR
jgi:phosphatidylglycerol:prolipoprotein diacylglycerol transferase